jgi:hypothetical protein
MVRIRLLSRTGHAHLGEAALAAFITVDGTPNVELLVRSGNVELDYVYSAGGAPLPDRAMLLAAGIAMAREGLAALANPAASSFP